MQKKNLLLILFSMIFIILVIQGICYAYQTVIINFPEDKVWTIVYNRTQANERIIQFVPQGQSYLNWTETYIFHSYKHQLGTNVNSLVFLSSLTKSLERKNNTKPYIYVLKGRENAIATRCIASNKNIKSQCDIYRVASAQEAVISIQYINKNTTDFKRNYEYYMDIIKRANPYYSYFRHDRVMSKGTSFEL